MDNTTRCKKKTKKHIYIALWTALHQPCMSKNIVLMEFLVHAPSLVDLFLAAQSPVALLSMIFSTGHFSLWMFLLRIKDTVLSSSAKLFHSILITQNKDRAIENIAMNMVKERYRLCQSPRTFFFFITDC